MAQAVAIWVEETFFKLAVMFGICQVHGDGLARVAVYMWTGVFLLYSLMLWSDWVAATGPFTEDPFGFNSLSGSWCGNWAMGMVREMCECRSKSE
jgi:TM2 domain-containing membrane protein YozV